jgi:hypothetical protein
MGSIVEAERACDAANAIDASGGQERECRAGGETDERDAARIEAMPAGARRPKRECIDDVRRRFVEPAAAEDQAIVDRTYGDSGFDKLRGEIAHRLHSPRAEHERAAVYEDDGRAARCDRDVKIGERRDGGTRVG